ncbi:MAG TPA: RNA polymerase sigma factor [Candidatus Dormibacteraeota bacterium]|nr:RNA polymerase sigma factor [Candidatus Dormibacteraeota bacterium]
MTRVDDAAFSDFYLGSAQRVAGIVALALGRSDLAEDATQEAYLRAHARWERVAGLERPDLWVVRVAVNLARDMMRGRRLEAAPLAADAPGQPVTAGEREIEALWVEWGLSQLSPMQRAAVVLHHVEGREIAEIATAMDRSRETVKTHLKLARARLRRLLEDPR